MGITQVAPKLNLGMRMIPIQPGEFVFQGVHGVRQNGFKIAQTPCTNEQFYKILKTMPSELSNIVIKPEKRLEDSMYLATVHSEAEKCPMVLLSWREWYEVAQLIGKRLPTELEWERAAAFTDGRPYPWGHIFDHEKAVFLSPGVKAVNKYASASPEGIYGLSGNVREITSSYHGIIDFSYPCIPKFPGNGRFFVTRGGSFGDASIVYLRNDFRNSLDPETPYVNVGCRFAQDLL
jgi:formylglycine-generating enzyme required for sulfatase activity